MVVTFGQGGIQ